MKVQCAFEFLQLEGILELGDVVELEIIRAAHRQVLNYTMVFDLTDKTLRYPRPYTLVEDNVREAGTMIGYHFLSKNGEYYSDAEICGLIGYKSLDEIFEKITD